MMRKLLFTSLALGLILATLMPTTVVVAKSHSDNVVANGVATFIAPTELGETVDPAGNRWRVADRTVGGIFGGPGIAGDFLFTYHANVNELQAGNLQGFLTTSQYTLNIVGKSEIAFGPIGYTTELAGYGIPFAPVYQIEINGVWTVLSGGKGNGTFTVILRFVPSPDGEHIAYIPVYEFQSPITLKGNLTP